MPLFLGIEAALSSFVAKTDLFHWPLLKNLDLRKRASCRATARRHQLKLYREIPTHRAPSPAQAIQVNAAAHLPEMVQNKNRFTNRTSFYIIVNKKYSSVLSQENKHEPGPEREQQMGSDRKRHLL